MAKMRVAELSTVLSAGSTSCSHVQQALHTILYEICINIDQFFYSKSDFFVICIVKSDSQLLSVYTKTYYGKLRYKQSNNI